MQRRVSIFFRGPLGTMHWGLSGFDIPSRLRAQDDDNLDLGFLMNQWRGSPPGIQDK